MAFDKDRYWREKPNNIGSKRPKPQVTPTGSAELIFADDKILTKNRRHKRRKIVNRLYTRKGYIAHLDAIRIVRRKHGKTTVKYVKINGSVI